MNPPSELFHCPITDFDAECVVIETDPTTGKRVLIRRMDCERWLSQMDGVRAMIVGSKPKRSMRHDARMSKKKNRVLQQFRLPADISTWLESSSKKIGKTKTRLVEEALRARMLLKGGQPMRKGAPKIIRDRQKLNLYLDGETVERLKLMAEERHTSISAVVREVIALTPIKRFDPAQN